MWGGNHIVGGLRGSGGFVVFFEVIVLAGGGNGVSLTLFFGSFCLFRVFLVSGRFRGGIVVLVDVIV